MACYMCKVMYDQCIQVHIVLENTLFMFGISFGTKFMLGVSSKDAPKSWLALG